jgi:tetratricopeptide (TPR) repeat protein
VRILPHFLVLSAAFAAPAWADQQHHHELSEQEVGSVHFATSCAKASAAGMDRAVAMLHSFQYEQARGAFASVSAADPQCAMAPWGIAMSHYHGLWENGDIAAGRAALQKAQQIAGSNPATTAREKAYISALAEIYREDVSDPAARGRAFGQKMGELQKADPLDNEAAVFHALSLAITAPKTDKTFANQRQCGEILTPLFRKQPHHPGVAHYLIHCYDNPVLAAEGLEAARAYAKIAPASAHAQHMPSHIFTRVGSWDESIASNTRAAEVAAAAEAGSTNGEARDQRLHAMDYLEYAYLQSGRVKLAKAVLDEMQALPPLAGLTLTGDYAIAAIPARYTVELGNWEEAGKLTAREGGGAPWAQAITWMTVGLGSARSGNLERAAVAAETLAALRDQATARGSQYWANQIEVQRREVAAWVFGKRGKGDEALSTLRSAADLEESMDKSPVTPGAITPAREMLAEFLLLEHNPRQALAEYEAVLQVAPNRFNALYGAACAAEAAGDATAAREYFQKLVATAGAGERAELATARRKLTELPSAETIKPERP